MSRSLITVIVLFLGGAVAAAVRAQDPGPPVTLEELPCSFCHTCENPTAKNPCLRGCPRTSAAIVAKMSQKGGPDVVILDELEDVYLPVPFDHKGHAEMAQMTRGCSTCHHYTSAGHQHPACKTCHAVEGPGTDIHKPGLKGAYHRQCLNCHRDWIDETDCGICHRRKTGRSEADGETVSPTADDIMGRMHPPITQPSTEIYRAEDKEGGGTVVIFRHWEHVQGFDLNCVDCHHEDNCARCHRQYNGQEPPKPRHEHHRPCVLCHKADMDETVTEITGRCKRCHWQEGWPAIKPFDHADTGWPLSKYHVGNRCRACHKAVPFVKQPKDCDTCHSGWKPDTFNHAVTGQPLDENHAETDCEECRVERKFDRPPTCDECHEEDEGITFPAKRPGPVLKGKESGTDSKPVTNAP